MSIEEKFAIITQKEKSRALGAEMLRGILPSPDASAEGDRAEDADVLRRHLKSEQEHAVRQGELIATLRREAAENEVKLRAADSRIAELETTNALQRDRMNALNEGMTNLQHRLSAADALTVELQRVIGAFEKKAVFEWPPESKLNPELRTLIVSFLERGDMGGLENLLDRLIRYDDKLHTLLKHTYFKEKVEELYGRYFNRPEGPQRRGADTAPGVPLSGTNGEKTLGFGPGARTLGLLFIDLDNFKSINDNMGHDAGDAALEQVAMAISESLRQSDIKGRFGGEELEAAVELESPADGQKVARKIVKAIEALNIKHGEFTFKITASVGIAELQPGEDLDGLISRANWAMKYAKHLGKNRFIPAELDDATAWAEQKKREEAAKEKSAPVQP